MLAITLAKLLRKERRFKGVLPLVLGAFPEMDSILGFPPTSPLGYHRALHSWMIASIVYLPFLILYGATSLPYYVAVVQHPLIGDFLANDVPLFYPFTTEEYGLLLSTYDLKLLVGLEIAIVTIFFVIVKNGSQIFINGSRLNLSLILVSPLYYYTIIYGINSLFQGGTLTAYSIFAITSGAYFLYLTVHAYIRYFKHT